MRPLLRPSCTLPLCLLILSSCADDASEGTSTPVTMRDMAVALDLANPARDMRQGAQADMATQPPVKDMDTAVKDATAAMDMSQMPDLSSAVDMAPPPTRGSKGCQGKPVLTEGEHTFMLDGIKRKFVVRLPKAYSHKRDWPLVFALHGNNGSVGYWDGNDPSRQLRKELQDEAILIVTEAIDRQWRDYKAEESTWAGRVEQELAYFDRLVSRASDELCVNTDAIFSMGFSGGGSFSGVLGCRRTYIRAIAVGGSVIYFDPKDCVSTPAAWITIGEKEQNAGRTEFREFFRERAGCKATSKATRPEGCVAYEGCASKTPVHYCTHPDGHIWPKFGVGPAWTFFGQFVTP